MMNRKNLFIWVVFIFLFARCKNDESGSTGEKVSIYSAYVENKLIEIKDIDLLIATRDTIYKRFKVNNRDDSRKDLKYNIVNNCMVFIVEANVIDNIKWIPKIKNRVGNKIELDACVKNEEIKIGTQDVLYIVSICLEPIPKDSLDISLSFCE